MANVTGTVGNDFIHLADDGLTVPPGYTDNPGATDGDDFFTLLDGDDIAHAGLGIDTAFLDEALPYYDTFFHADTTIDVTARFGTTDGDKELHGVEELVFLTGTASVDVSNPGVGRVRTGSGADTVSLSGNVIGGVAQNWLSQDRGLFGGDFNTMTFESFGALNLNTGGGNDTVDVGIVMNLGWTPFTDSSGNAQVAPPLAIDLGAGNDALDLTNLEFSSFDSSSGLFSRPPPDPGRFHLLAGASPVQVRMGAGDDAVTIGPAAGPVTVADNRIGSEDPGVNIIDGVGLFGNWIGFSGLGIAAGSSGVAIDMAIGIATSSITGHQTTFSGMQNVEGTRGNDTVTCDNTANIVDLVAGADHVTCGDQEAGRFDMVAFSGANGGLAINLAAGTAAGGTGSGLVDTTFTGAEGGFGTNFADSFDCSAQNDLVFGLGENDTVNCGDGDSDMVGFTGLFDQYSIVQNPDGTITVTDLRTPAEILPGSVSDGVDTCSDAEIFRFADQLVCADAAGSADFHVNAVDIASGLVPGNMVGGAGDDDKVKVTLEDAGAVSQSIEITPTPSPSGGDQGAIFMALLFGIGMVVEYVEDIEVDSTSDDAVFADIHGDFTNTALAANTLTLNTGAGADTLDASGVISNHRVVMNAAGGADTLLGGAGADILDGGAGNDTLDGGDGADSIRGGTGSDTLRGQQGDDFLFVDSGGDRVIEIAGQGVDRVLSSISHTLSSTAEIEMLTTTNAALTTAIDLTGNGLAQTLVGNAGANRLNGRGGADTMNGMGGDDFYFVDHIGDIVIAAVGAGNDRVLTSAHHRLAASAEIEMLTTTNVLHTTNLQLIGNNFGQTIIGNAGHNTLAGKGGNDILNGGAGNDFFVFDTALGAGNVDTIVGYATANDTIRLDDAIFTQIAAGAGGFLVSTQFASNAAGQATNASHRIVYENDTGSLFYDADGTGGAARIQFATLSAGLAMTHTEFYVI